MKTIHETEVVVVGAGAVGCSIAYWLAKRGKDVTLVDRAHPGTGTSALNFGLVWVSTKEPLAYMELSLQSSSLWPKMVEELAEDVELRQDRGGLKLCMTPEEFANAEATVARQRRSSLYKGRMLSPEEVLELQPGVSREIAGAMWSPHNGDCNPVKWVSALTRGCERLGVTIMKETEVVGFDLDAERNAVAGVLTDKGRIKTSVAVNSAGVWAAEIARMVGVQIELYPQRGQILMTEPGPIACPTPMSLVRQDAHGTFWMGVTREDVGFDWSTTAEAAEQITRNAARMVPATRELSIVRQFAGLRPMPKDELPFLGPVARIPGYYIAVGHSGITLSPIHGKIISDLVIDGRTDVPIADYDPLRYETQTI